MFQRLIEEYQEDLKRFIYWCLVFTVLRIIFIVIFRSQLAGNYTDIPMALYLGLRLSLKTAGCICFIGFVLASLPRVLLRSWPAKTIRFAWHSLTALFFSLCFMVRIPYYELYHAAFNMVLFNGLHDDKQAIFASLVKEYQLGWRLLGVLLITIVIIKAGEYFCSKLPKISLKSSWTRVVPTLLFMCLLVDFVYWGGGFTKRQAVWWDNIARFSSNLLNEAILDDGQALHRVYKAKRSLDKAISKAVSKDDLKKELAVVGVKENTTSIDAAFERTVVKPKIAVQPNNIVFILGESFSEWPFLDKFAPLELVPQMTQLRKSPHAGVVKTVLPASTLTIKAVDCLFSGLPDNELYENYRPQSFSAKYKMGLAYIMKSLGYKTVLWYGGFGAWHNFKDFALAQCFDEFHGADEFDMSKEYAYISGSPWGVSDELLLDNVTEYIKKQNKDEKVFHFILTTSDHSPYPIDVDSLGFHRQKVKENLAGNFNDTPKDLRILGHVWYADRTMGAFVEKIQKDKEDSLFVLTGDHAGRAKFAIDQELKAHYAVPCLFYGRDVKAEWFADAEIGSTMQIACTLAELIAPRGFVYSSLLPSMLSRDNELVFNHSVYAKHNELEELETLDEKSKDYVEAIRNIAIYRVLKGDSTE